MDPSGSARYSPKKADFEGAIAAIRKASPKHLAHQPPAVRLDRESQPTPAPAGSAGAARVPFKRRLVERGRYYDVFEVAPNRFEVEQTGQRSTVRGVAKRAPKPQPQADPKDAPATAPAFSPGFEFVSLHDVQGLWGGQNIWVAADGRIAWRWVGLTGGAEDWRVERHFEGRLSSDQIRTLSNTLRTHDLRTVRKATRDGHADEASPTIVLQTAAEPISAWKWDGDSRPTFDTIALTLRAMAINAFTDAEPSYEGKWDHTWAPAWAPKRK